MTRDFSKQRRENARPSSRNTSSGRYGEERSPRPARPRLNRETVDQAWEKGAPQRHADYRTSRKDSNQRTGQTPRDSRRRDFKFDHSSAQSSRNSPNRSSNYRSRQSGRPFGNQQDNNRRSEGILPGGQVTPYGNQNPRYRSTDSGNSRFNDRQAHSYVGRPGETRSHRSSRDNERYRDSADQYPDRKANRGYGNPVRGTGNQGRDLDRSNRYPRDLDRDNRSPRNVERGNRRSPSRGFQRPDTQNPRWQSRPATQRGSAHSRPGQDFPKQDTQEEQFEGDYERFDAPKTYQHPSTPRRFQGNLSGSSGQGANERTERPVTRLSDGRVLKGPRSVQRKNAQFWNEITEEAEALVDSAQAPPVEQPAEPAEATPVKQEKPNASPKSVRPRTPRTPTASAIVRRKKTDEAGTKKRASKPRSTGPKPSQRGFKWPRPEG